TRFTLHYFACTCQLVQRLAIALERRVHRRYLADWTTKLWQYGFNVAATNGHFAGLQNFAFGVARVGGLPQLHHRLVALVGLEQVLRELGDRKSTRLNSS